MGLMPIINGQFVNKSQIGGQQPSAPTGQGNGQYVSGIDNSKLQQLLGLYAVSKGNPSEAWNIFKPSDAAIKRQETAQASQQSLEDTVNNVDDILQKWKNMPELERRLPQRLVSAFPFLSPTRTGILSNFYTSVEPDLRKAAVGGRITQQEISWIRNALLPGPADSYESATAKIKGLRDSLVRKSKNSSFNIVPQDTGTGDWEVVSQ